jgi:hypothetical protein
MSKTDQQKEALETFWEIALADEKKSYVDIAVDTIVMLWDEQEKTKELKKALGESQIFLEQLISYRSQHFGITKKVSNMDLIKHQFEVNDKLLAKKP